MVRSTLKPGPYEGQAVIDKDGEKVGTLQSLDVTGTHVESLSVRLDDDSVRHVPRDWFLETVREGIQLVSTADEVRALEPASPTS